MSKIIPGYDCVAEVRKIREARYAEYGENWDAYWERIETAPERFLATLDLSRVTEI